MAAGSDTLWDFYVAGVRPFDHLASAIILGVVLLRRYQALM